MQIHSLSLPTALVALVELGVAACVRPPAAALVPAAVTHNLRPVATDSADYRRLVTQAKAGDANVDFAALRFLFARLPAPARRVSPESLIQRAKRAPSHTAARVALDSLLDDYYGSAIAHEIALGILRGRGDSAGARDEAQVFDRYVRSIGDGPQAGMTMATAMDVVGVPEEYLYLRARGYTRSGFQSDYACNGGECDELEVVETKTGKHTKIYFRWARAGDRPPHEEFASATRIVAENDDFDFSRLPSQRSDDNYTQGARLAWNAAGVLPAARRIVCRPADACATTLEVGQEIYTPTDDSSVPLPGERSFAGWLYARAGVVAARASTRREVAATVGVTGPASLARQAQEWVHHLKPRYRQPLGWKYQLPTEPDMALQLTQGWYLAPRGDGARWMDLVPTAQATAGTLRTAAGVGGRLRLGFDLDHPWLVDATPHSFSAFAFVGGQGEAVARDLFLDGLTFRPSLHRDHEPLVSNWERGIGVRIRHLGVEYRLTSQSREYRAGPATHTFGGITLAWWSVR